MPFWHRLLPHSCSSSPFFLTVRGRLTIKPFSALSLCGQTWPTHKTCCRSASHPKGLGRDGGSKSTIHHFVQCLQRDRQSQTSRSVNSPCWRLASRTTNNCSWAEALRWSCQGCSDPPIGLQSLWITHVHMRKDGECTWAAWTINFVAEVLPDTNVTAIWMTSYGERSSEPRCQQLKSQSAWCGMTTNDLMDSLFCPGPKEKPRLGIWQYQTHMQSPIFATHPPSQMQQPRTQNKNDKYARLSNTHIFYPFATGGTTRP